MLRTLIIGLVVSLGFGANPAFAQAQGTLTLGSLGFTLVDLAPNDGITPSLTWGPWPVVDGSNKYNEGGIIVEDRDGETRNIIEYFWPGPAPVEGLVGNAMGRLHQRDAQDEIEMVLTSRAGIQDQPERQGARTLGYSGSIPFTISANTRVVFELDVHASGSIVRGDEYFERFQTYQLLSLVLGGAPIWDDDLFTLESAADGPFEPFADYFTTLSASAENASNLPLSGTARFEGRAEAISMLRPDVLPSPVPEPHSLPAFMAGLGIIALWARRRRLN